MSRDHELANEWARCSEKNASYITINNYSRKWRRLVLYLLFASELANQNARNALFTCVVYTAID